LVKIKHICFDLDGTLVNSRETIIKSTTASLDALSIKHNIDQEIFAGMIGLHFNEIFREFDIDIPDFNTFIEIYKTKYFDFISDSVLYDGVENILELLSRRDIKISLLTTKGQDQAEKLVDYFGLKKYFSLVMGRRDGLQHKPSPESLIFICDELNITPLQTLMVGDTELDIMCGKSAGSFTCGVLYGYRSEDRLREINPDFLIKNLNELKSVIL